MTPFILQKCSSLKCKLLISLPELMQNVAAVPFSYISLMLSTLTQVSELPSVPMSLPETSSSILHLQYSCPLQVRSVVNWNVGSDKLVLCSAKPPVWSSPGADAVFPVCNSVNQKQEFFQGFSSACLEHACSTRSKVIAQECGSAMFSPFSPSLAVSTYLEFLQTLSPVLYSF